MTLAVLTVHVIEFEFAISFEYIANIGSSPSSLGATVLSKCVHFESASVTRSLSSNTIASRRTSRNFAAFSFVLVTRVM